MTTSKREGSTDSRPERLRLWIDAKTMSGETISELEIGDAPTDGEGPMVEVRATAMSGDIRVKRT